MLVWAPVSSLDWTRLSRACQQCMTGFTSHSWCFGLLYAKYLGSCVPVAQSPVLAEVKLLHLRKEAALHSPSGHPDLAMDSHPGLAMDSHPDLATDSRPDMGMDSHPNLAMETALAAAFLLWTHSVMR